MDCFPLNFFTSVAKMARSLPCPTDSLWNPQELNLAGTSAKFSIPGSPNSGGMESFRNWNRNGPGIDRNGIRRNGINIKILNEYDTAAKWQRRHPKKHVTSSNNSKHHTTSNVTTSPP